MRYIDWVLKEGFV